MNSEISTIIIEDDIHSQEYLATILSRNFNMIKIHGYAGTILKSLELINTIKPELIFMDIELIDGVSFEIFNQLKNHDFEVIFITAYEDYIKNALEHYAFSFIIKPIDEDKLIRTVNRYINFKERMFSENKYQLLNNFLAIKNARLLIHSNNKDVLIEINDIIKCEANGNYTWFYLKGDKKHLASKNLKYYDNLLTNRGFFRSHRSIIVNVIYIDYIYKKETIILKNKERINVSARNKSNLSVLINSMA